MGARVPCTVEYTEIENERFIYVPGIVVTCGECEHTVQCFGQEGPSIRRAFAMLREECPEGESNFYVDENDG